MKLSISIIVKNEEACLANCLETIKDADEIIIVDTGSTDNTIDIAKKYTNNIYYMTWNDDFSEARNFANSKCTGDWIFSIDADHELESSIEFIKKEIEKLEELNLKIGQIKSICGNAYHWRAVLFKNNSDIKWIGKVHEYLSEFSDYKTDIIENRTYSNINHVLDPDRNLRILLNSKMNKRVKFYLGREYFERQDYENAIDWMNEYLKEGFWIPEVAEAYFTISKSYWYLQDGNNARKYCLEAIRWNPDFREALYFMSEIYYEPWKSKWFNIAKNATNEDVLFVRN